VIWAIIRKDLKEILSRPKIWIPMIFIPFFLTVVQPAIVFLSAAKSKPKTDGLGELLKYVSTQHVFQSEIQKMSFVMIDYLFPMLFLLIPILTSSLIAANSFAGEKERKTLESLLYTPLTLKQLFFAKILGTFIPAYAVTIGSFLLFCGVVHLFATSYLLLLPFPNWRWIVLLTTLCPTIVLLSLTFSIWISARCTTYQEAQQMGGLVVIPFLGLVLGQVSGWFMLEIPQILLLSVGIGVLDYFLLVLATKTFTYERLLQ
jgi:ABC-type Na+ efflux pump permease subunit